MGGGGDRGVSSRVAWASSRLLRPGLEPLLEPGHFLHIAGLKDVEGVNANCGWPGPALAAGDTVAGPVPSWAKAPMAGGARAEPGRARAPACATSAGPFSVAVLGGPQGRVGVGGSPPPWRGVRLSVPRSV